MGLGESQDAWAEGDGEAKASAAGDGEGADDISDLIDGSAPDFSSGSSGLESASSDDDAMGDDDEDAAGGFGGESGDQDASDWTGDDGAEGVDGKRRRSKMYDVESYLQGILWNVQVIQPPGLVGPSCPTRAPPSPSPSPIPATSALLVQVHRRIGDSQGNGCARGTSA